MQYMRLYAGPDGESHFEDIAVALSPTPAGNGLSALYPGAGGQGTRRVMAAPPRCPASIAHPTPTNYRLASITPLIASAPLPCPSIDDGDWAKCRSRQPGTRMRLYVH